jgi:aminoglycoside 6'-N-acetyltransferase I
MIVRPVRPDEASEWLAMRQILWPETSEPEHREEMAMMLSDADRYAVLVCEDRSGSLRGFAEVSLRQWAEGCRSSPVAYLEGWFVAAESRRQGLGRMLVEAAEDWARARGCTELGSDTDLGNTQSEAVHLRLGFEIAARVTAFRKRL